MRQWFSAVVAILVLAAILPRWTQAQINPSSEQEQLASDVVRAMISKEAFLSAAKRVIPTEMRAQLAARLDYSRLVASAAKPYASTFSVEELRSLIAFYKTDAAKRMLAVSDRIGIYPKPRPQPESPPSDTQQTRLAAAMSLAEITLTKEVVLGGAKLLLDDQPAAERNKIVSQLEATFADPARVLAMRLSSAKRYVPIMTTDQIRKVVAFYSTPTGRKVISSGARFAVAFRDATTNEIRRALGSQ